MKAFFIASFFLLLLGFLPVRISAQDITIKGRVTSSEDGSALPGASILVKGTLTGAVTNPQGQYQLQAGKNSVLVFSFVGYESQEIPVNSRTTIDVVLMVSQLKLQEIVVTALGIRKEKKALGYSVQEVDGASLEKAKEPNVISSLTGLNWYGLLSDLRTPKSYILYSDPTDGNYEVQMDKDLNLNTDVFLEYRNSWNDVWELNVSVGGNNRWEEHNYLYSRTTGLNIPGFYNLSNSTGDVRASNTLRQKKVNSIYGTLDLNYKKAIFLGITSRNDWSSALPLENNSYFYPSISLSTIVSELIDLPAFIPFFKLRGSWAQVSNDLAVYSTTPAYNNAINWNSNASVSFPGSQLNPDIRPETSKTWELGSDIRFLKNRVGLDVTYYHTIDENDIIYFPVSQASGYSSKLINANKYKREGWEVVLNLSPVKIQNTFTWDVAFNWSRHRRYLLELPEGITDLNGVKVGERMDLYRGWVFNKSADGKIIYEGGLPTWDPYIKKLGFQDPDWTWGFSNALSYKFIRLNILLDGRFKGLIWSQTIRKMYWGGTHPNTISTYRDDQIAGKATYVGEGVVVTGGEVIYDAQGNIKSDTRTYETNNQPVYWSDWCQYYYHDVSDEAVTFDASFLKLREITLTFDIPSKWTSRMRIEKASVSFIGRNIWMGSYIKYIDPDTGADNLQTPSSRNLGFNINLIF